MKVVRMEMADDLTWSVTVDHEPVATGLHGSEVCGCRDEWLVRVRQQDRQQVPISQVTAGLAGWQGDPHLTTEARSLEYAEASGGREAPAWQDADLNMESRGLIPQKP